MCDESPRIQLLHFVSWECSHLAQSAYHDKYITSLDNFYLSARSSYQGAQIWLLKGKNMRLWLLVTLTGGRDRLTAAGLRLLAAWINRLMFFSLSLFTLLRRSNKHFPAVTICYFKVQCLFWLFSSSKMTLWTVGSLDLKHLIYLVRYIQAINEMKKSFISCIKILYIPLFK